MGAVFATCGRRGGGASRRREVLDLFHRLETAPEATHSEALAFIERHLLMGLGIGNVDAHLLASAALADGAALWTADARLASAAARLSLGYDPASPRHP